MNANQTTDRSAQRAARARALKARKDAAPQATDCTKEAHELLRHIAEDMALGSTIIQLDAIQRKSEEEGWWDKDLGYAIETTLGHLRMALDAATRR